MALLTLDITLKKQNNNYDLVRLLSATTVIIFHTLYLFKGNDKNINTTLMHIWSLSGGWAVFVFFFLSGIFITASFVKHNNAIVFIIHRAFRIWPALIACACLAVFMIGPIVTTYSLKAYFTSSETFSYLLHNIILYKQTFKLPGVFLSNYYPTAVNGSLWTLPLEILCYLGVLVLGLTGVLKRPIIATIIYAVVLSLYYLNFHQIKHHIDTPFPYFIIGSLVYLFKRYIIIDYKVLGILIVLNVLFGGPVLTDVVLFYSVLYIGSVKAIRGIHLPGDYSYGIYIYGFVIQQVIANYFPQISRIESLLLTLPVTFILAVISWHFIEHPAIKSGKKIANSNFKSLVSFSKTS